MWQPGDGKSGWVEDAVNTAAGALARAARLDLADAERLRRWPVTIERHPAGSLINPLSAEPTIKWVISGWVSQMRILPDARRQMFAFLLPGDVVSCRPASGRNPCSLIALTRVECADVAQMLESAKTESERVLLRGVVNTALSAGEERKYDHIVRLGQHTASERVINLLIELRNRLTPLGLVSNDSFRLPITQEHLADALGLSLVHIHRTLKALRAQGLVEMRMGRVTLLKPEKLAQIASRGAH